MGTEEKLKDIVGYEGLYQISRNGVIRSLDKYLPMPNGGEKLVKGKILKPVYDRDGYVNVKLSKNGNIKKYQIHRLVAQAFIPNPDNLPVINHINEIKDDNRVENLEWCTAQYNSAYSLSKSIIQCNLNYEPIKQWKSIIDAERELNIHSTAIVRCCRGKSYTAGGYKWQYAN